MVVPFNDLRDGDAENLIHLVLSGFITRPTLPASLLISAHTASRASLVRYTQNLGRGTENVLQ